MGASPHGSSSNRGFNRSPGPADERPGEGLILARILAIADASLHRRLEVGFARGGVAEVSFAPALGQALLLAAVEQPDLVVCAEGSMEVGLAELWNSLVKLDLPQSQLLCVREQAPGQDLPAGVHVCSEEELFETLAELLPAASSASRRVAVELLASLDRMDCGDSQSGPSLANLLELGSEDLVLEAPLALELGQRLALGFFLPSEGDATSNRVSLTCAVDAVVDETCLHYHARLEYVDEVSRTALDDFLQQTASSGDVPMGDSEAR